VLDKELAAARLEVRVGRQGRQPLDKGIVGRRRIGVGRGDGVVERGKDARRPLLFNQVADNLVVEVIDRRPLDLLADVLLLLRLERELDKDLLDCGRQRQRRQRRSSQLDEELARLGSARLGPATQRHSARLSERVALTLHRPSSTVRDRSSTGRTHASR